MQLSVCGNGGGGYLALACRSVSRWDSVLFCVGRSSSWPCFCSLEERRGSYPPSFSATPFRPQEGGGGARFKRGKKQKVVEGGRGKNGRKTTKTRRRKEGERERRRAVLFLSGTLPAAELWIPLPWFFLQRGEREKRRRKR